ncbi:MAG: histidine phosphatase family protein [Ilumatobacter sp.]|nr:histidine phosphatase family protein [Ilumatobacter sp.]
MANLYLVRHAKAGERRSWSGDDVDRPLSKPGWKQAKLLGARLAELDPTTLCSSPYVRCVQTLEPLAERIGGKVEIEERLREEEPFEPVLDLLRELPPRSVLSTHGDLIPAVVMALERRGMTCSSRPDWRKASVWVLKRNKHGEIVSSTVWPPPS